MTKRETFLIKILKESIEEEDLIVSKLLQSLGPTTENADNIFRR